MLVFFFAFLPSFAIFLVKGLFGSGRVRNQFKDGLELSWYILTVGPPCSGCEYQIRLTMICLIHYHISGHQRLTMCY